MRSGYLPMTGKFSGALPLGRQDFLRGDIRVKKKKEKKKSLKLIQAAAVRKRRNAIQ